MGFAQASNAVPAFARVALARPAPQPRIAQRLLERRQTPAPRAQVLAPSLRARPVDTLFAKIQKVVRGWLPAKLLHPPRADTAEIVPLRNIQAEQRKQSPNQRIAEIMEKSSMSLPDNVFDLTEKVDAACAAELAILDNYRRHAADEAGSGVARSRAAGDSIDTVKMSATRAYRFTRVIEMIKSIRRNVYDQANSRHGAACHAAINVLSKKWQGEIERGSHRFSRASVVIDLDELIRSLEEIRQVAKGLAHEERS